MASPTPLMASCREVAHEDVSSASWEAKRAGGQLRLPTSRSFGESRRTSYSAIPTSLRVRIGETCSVNVPIARQISTSIKVLIYAL